MSRITRSKRSETCRAHVLRLGKMVENTLRKRRLSFDQVASHLNSSGVPVRRGSGEWTASRVALLMKQYRRQWGVDLRTRLDQPRREPAPGVVIKRQVALKKAAVSLVERADAHARNVGALIVALVEDGFSTAQALANELNRRKVKTRQDRGGWRKRNVLYVVQRYYELTGIYLLPKKGISKPREMRLVDGKVVRVK